MTRTEFNRFFAATRNNWFEAGTLNQLNDLAYAILAPISVDAADVDAVKSAFDRANNDL